MDTTHIESLESFHVLTWFLKYRLVTGVWRLQDDMGGQVKMIVKES